ncbi:MAG TPA: UDP-glucose--hexose-1-phosphate uridylyltransferase [Terriglobales bacterium]
MADELKKTPHRRLNPLTGEWILVSPHRTQRPWQGQVEKSPRPAALEYDPNCYLCPGNERAGGAKNPQYTSTFVFTNDYAALEPDAPKLHVNDSDLLVAQSERGTCRVICFSPRHDLTLARMERPAIRTVVDLWAEQYAELGARPEINSVIIFENRGEIMGASNPHPHGQVWANATIPNEPQKELLSQQRYHDERHSCLLCNYLAIESREAERIICENDSFVALVPFWAVWPFEVLLLPRRHARDLTALEDHERNDLADILKRMTTRYDNLFEISFPYSMGFHQAPTDGTPHPEWHVHAHFYPPLLRSATVRKFMVGYEMLATPQRDITPESAAERLRALSETHYLDGE